MKRRISPRFCLWAFCQFIVSCPGQYLSPENVVPNGYGFGPGLGYAKRMSLPPPSQAGVCPGNPNLMRMSNLTPPPIYDGFGNGMGIHFPSDTCPGCDIGQCPNSDYPTGLPDNYYRAGVPSAHYGGAVDLGGTSPGNLINGYGPRSDLSYGEGWGIPNADVLGAGIGGPSGGLPLTGPLAYASAGPTALAGFAPSFGQHHAFPVTNKRANSNTNTNVNVNQMHRGF